MKKTEKDPTASTQTQGEQLLNKLLLTRFSIRQLVAYIAVYDYRNIQAAAHDLYLDHSTVSKSISEIEAALNIKLFVRHTRGVIPTAAADVFYRHSKQIANQCARTAAELVTHHDRRGETRGDRLRVLSRHHRRQSRVALQVAA